MPLVVQKYGGTSVGTPERILNVARRVLATQQAGNSVVTVVSAMSGVTDSLIKLARDVSNKPTEREMDVLLATGEQTTIALTAMAINALGGKAVSLTGAQAGIMTDGIHTKAKIANISPRQIRKYLSEGYICIVAGFQGQTVQGSITTLGRGGSDLTAIAIAAALKANNCEIYTDVDGIYTCDPRIVPNARKIDVIAYDELLEMASSGSKVMQSRSVEFAKKFKVPFEVRSSFNTNRGTIVKEETPGLENVVVRGVSVERNQAKVTITNVPDRPGAASRIFTALADAHVIVDVIVQNVSAAGTTDISFTTNRDELEKLGTLLNPIVKEIGASDVLKQEGIAKLSVVGIGMRSHSGVAARLFEALAKGGVNIEMISTSEIKIAVILDEAKIVEAANLAHEAFGLAQA
ncbi:aspartate kinase [Spartobacteria bacterium LR76]|uniref:Aspartokinase n=1 Tax=Terrimicrobium sacchariphilum TaxID=690879 RepID=A0A146G977_TERSA|nr:aspartate kinase [Terrimicrobium sacchariphilum]PTX93616.1 aspartate kinase [Spartobacteria bacterium LR76]GAT34229.1 aspartate kinase [Terrimicrobium sacchariphilum]